MKKFFVIVIVSFLMPPLFMKAEDIICSVPAEEHVYKKEHKPQFLDENDKVAQLVIASWLGMVNNVVEIGKNPHDKQNVGSNVSQMIHSIAHVVSEATKKYNISPEEFMDICKRRCVSL